MLERVVRGRPAGGTLPLPRHPPADAPVPAATLQTPTAVEHALAPDAEPSGPSGPDRTGGRGRERRRRQRRGRRRGGRGSGRRGHGAHGRSVSRRCKNRLPASGARRSGRRRSSRDRNGRPGNGWSAVADTTTDDPSAADVGAAGVGAAGAGAGCPGTADPSTARPAPGRPPTRRGSRRRRRVVLVGLVLLVLAGVAAILVPTLGSGGTTRSGRRSRRYRAATTQLTASEPSVASTAKAGRPSRKATSRPPTTTRPPASPAPPATGDLIAPVGFTRYTDPRDGFSLIIPSGWRPVRRDTRVDFDDPGSTRFLRIDTSDTPLADPYQNWVDYERQFRQGKSGYRLVGIRRVPDYRPSEGWSTRIGSSCSAALTCSTATSGSARRGRTRSTGPHRTASGAPRRAGKSSTWPSGASCPRRPAASGPAAPDTPFRPEPPPRLLRSRHRRLTAAPPGESVQRTRPGHVTSTSSAANFCHVTLNATDPPERVRSGPAEDGCGARGASTFPPRRRHGLSVISTRTGPPRPLPNAPAQSAPVPRLGKCWPSGWPATTCSRCRYRRRCAKHVVFGARHAADGLLGLTVPAGHRAGRGLGPGARRRRRPAWLRAPYAAGRARGWR